MYPDDSVQFLTHDWWVPETSTMVERGRLLRVFVPYPEMKPHRLVPEGRGDDPTSHARARFVLEPYRMGDPPRAVDRLPVAALPLRDGETYYVQRGKMRPAVVLSVGGLSVTNELRRGSARWQSAPAFLVAPYYGAVAGGSRGGWPEKFVQRIRRAEYPQYVWDKLPIGGVEESILRLDHLFPIGVDLASYVLLPHRLGEEALALLDQWVTWLLTGRLDPDNELSMIRGEFSSL